MTQTPWIQPRPPRKVLMTCDAVGGVWTYALELARGFANHDVQVLLAVMGPAPSHQQVQEARELPNVELAHQGFALEWTDDPWSDVEAAGEWLLELAADFQAEVIHLNGFAHATLPWGVPVLTVAHSCVLTWWRAVKGGNPPPRYDKYRNRVEAALESTFVVTPTEAFRAQLALEYGLKLRGKTIHNARRHRSGPVGAKEPMIFSAGRLWDDAKNLAILDAVAPAVKWPIFVAGDELLPGAGQFTSCNVQAMGRLPPDELLRVMARAAIYAAPAKYEPFGLSILEAALSGCALVLSDIPTLRETWCGSAEFVPPHDPNAWRRAFNALLSDPGRLKALQFRARRAAAQYSVEVQTDAYLKVYQTLVSAASAGAELLSA